MARREIIGTMPCPECGMEGAEVKWQKSGLAYRWCPECNAQYFTRTKEASDRLLAKVGAGGTAKPVTVSEEKPKAAQEMNAAPAAPAAPAKKGTGNALLDLIQGAA